MEQAQRLPLRFDDDDGLRCPARAPIGLGVVEDEFDLEFVLFAFGSGHVPLSVPLSCRGMHLR